MNNNDHWILERPIAHRGLHDGNQLVPENSLAAFQKAMAQNYPLELDLQLLKDGTVIVFHDDDLQRACGVPTTISESALADLKDLRLFHSEETIPTLAETLAFVNGKVPLLIELKNGGLGKQLEKNTLKVLSDYQGEVALQSMNPFTVRWLKKHYKGLVGQVATRYEKPTLLRPILNYFQLNKRMKLDFVAYDKSFLPNKTVAYFKEQGLPILCWTIVSAQEANHYQAYCDTIIFELFTPVSSAGA